jgi:CO/xanthine dehydrogenase Mo-binding subunit
MRTVKGFPTDGTFEVVDGARSVRGVSQSVPILPHMCPSPLSPRSAPTTTVGRSVPRREGADKVTGRARYTDDIAVPGAWYGRTVRSTIARGTIRTLTLDPAFDWTRVVVVTADDIPGDNVVHLIRDDQPVLAPRGAEIRHKQEPILLLAAPDRATLAEAARHIRIEYDTAEPVLALAQATEVFHTVDITKGDVDAAAPGAHLVVEREFRVGLQEQLYIEPQGAIAVPEPGGVIRIIGSLQCPYYVHRALKRALRLTDEQAVVIQAETGGGFGGKEEYPSMVAIHAALLAQKAGRPVRLIYDRHEDLAATTKRHPGVIRHRTAVARDGTLLSQDIEIVLDGGAYCTLTPVVLSRAAIHAAGPYSCPNVRIRARAVATNTPPNGAFRGFGAPQSLFAAELMVEHVAERLGMASVDLRRKWMLRLGDTTATGQVLTESVGSELVLDAALNAAPTAQPPNRPTVRRGRGLSLVFHGSGFTGSGEQKLQGTVALEALADGTFRILTASTEIGQGTKTIFCQLAADALGVPLERVVMAPQDTSLVPDSGPTVASRTAMIVGRLVQEAALELSQRLQHEPAPLRVQKSYIQPDSLQWDETTYRGDAYPIYAWACTIADVDVDMTTGEVRVTDLVTAVDCGKALHPVMAEGQIEGGSLQAVGWATLEEIKMQDGGYQNDRLATYLIPTALDAPRIRTILVENPYSRGPFGAKGIGELPMDGPAPAIIAAIHDATGVWLDEIPATPEKVLAACASR